MSWRGAVLLAVLLASGCGRLGFGSDVERDAATGPDAETFAELCARDGVTLCETFEGDTAATWDFAGSPLPVVTTDQSHGAGHSMLSVAGPGGQSSYLGNGASALIPSPHFYARAWIYLPTADTIGHVNLVTLDSDMGGYSLVVELGANGTAKGTVDIGGDHEKSVEKTGDTTLPKPLKYVYLGASYSGPNQAAQMRVYLDDFLIGRDPVGCYP
ncbi:MAG TPA: hypothetical protein VGM90_13400 [Kofleriaceae bacterium]|jgi:hypothetical protein